jgi:uncharacterized protein (TIGR02466 family)
MPKVELWFPVAIYTEEDILTEGELEKIKEHCLTIETSTKTGGEDWVGGTYNTHGTHDLSKDLEFQPLLDKITWHVNQFANMHNSEASYTDNGAWVNIAGEGAWQEFHTHNGNVFSAVFYVAAPEGSGKIVFEDPKEPDMCQLTKIKRKNELSFTRISYTPKPNMLVIFRAYLRHLVEPGKNTEPRISIAVNFT